MTLEWENGQPAMIRCHKCDNSEFVIPLSLARKRVYDAGPGPWRDANGRPTFNAPPAVSRLGPLYVSEFAMPEKWTKIVVTECVSPEVVECVKPPIYVCPDCTITITVEE